MMFVFDNFTAKLTFEAYPFSSSSKKIISRQQSAKKLDIFQLDNHSAVAICETKKSGQIINISIRSINFDEEVLNKNHITYNIQLEPPFSVSSLRNGLFYQNGEKELRIITKIDLKKANSECKQFNK